MNNKEILETAIAVAGTATALAEKLRVSGAYLSNVRNGKKPMSPAMAGKLAEMVGADPVEAILEAEEAQADPENAEVFRRAKRRIQETAAATVKIALLLTVWTAAPESGAIEPTTSPDNELSIPYAQRRNGKRRKQAARARFAPLALRSLLRAAYLRFAPLSGVTLAAS